VSGVPPWQPAWQPANPGGMTADLQ